MKLALLALSAVACSAGLTNVQFTGTDNGWYETDFAGSPYWDAKSTANVHHLRFPRSGDKAFIPSGSTCKFQETDIPAAYAGQIAADIIAVDGVLVIEEADTDEGENVLKIGDGETVQHCVIGDWEAYSTCTKSCDSGTMTRKRTHTAPRFGGNQCPHDEETKSCNTHECPKAAEMGDWQPWSTCTKSCDDGSGGGSQKRSRACTVPEFGGVACRHTIETQPCNTHACPIACPFEKWGGWTVCTKDCDTGSRSRERVVGVAQFGGVACPHSEETEPCNTQHCPHLCSHTTCKYKYRDGEWRTIVMHTPCLEKHGMDYHCEHHFGTQIVNLLGGEQQTHTDKCVCHCDFEGSTSIAHRHITGDENTDLTDSAHQGLHRRVRHVGDNHLGHHRLSC